MKNFAWHIRFDLDIEKMQAALKIIEGTHDFSAFKAASCTNMNPIRTMYAAELFLESAEILTIKIHASGFLYHMARNIVSAVVEVGRQRLTLENFQKIFESGERKLFPATAPAHGLYLYQVFY